MQTFKSKADTLRGLAGRLASAKVLPQVCFTAKDAGQCIPLLEEGGLLGRRLIVRSSAKNEDTAESSNAGEFLSIPDVCGEEEVRQAVRQAVEAMGPDPENQVFIQPFLSQVELCGVAFTADPNTGGHYYILNYDASTGSTSSVTDGTGEHLETFYHFKKSPYPAPEPLDRVIALCQELEGFLAPPCWILSLLFPKGNYICCKPGPLSCAAP